MTKLSLISNDEINFSLANETTLHENIVEILFKYKEKLCYRFENIRGTFLIDYFAVYIIDSDKNIIIFSTTPSLEYNLISNQLWKHDKAFSLDFNLKNYFYPWDKAYSPEKFSELNLIKQFNHNFSFGFNLAKKIESFQLVYSFATRSKDCEFFEYYQSYVNELFALGDYGYDAIREFCFPHSKMIPIQYEISKQTKKDSFLKLISNNEI